MGVTFEEFAEHSGARLRAGLVAAYGPEVGADAAAGALAYGFEHWERLSTMTNPAGYLYRVGQSEARRHFRPESFMPARPAVREARKRDLPLERVAAVVLARWGPGVRPPRRSLSRCSDGVEESDAESVDTILVPELCFHHFSGRKRVKPDVARHRARRA